MYARTLPIGRAVFAALFLLLANACQNTQAGLHAELQGPFRAGVDYSRLEVRVYSADSQDPLSTTALEGKDLPALPYKMNFMSGSKTRAGSEVRLVAELSLEGKIVSRTEGSGFLRRAGGGNLTLVFSPLEQTVDTLPPIPVPQDPNKLPNGQVCATADQCRSSFCAQARCCDTACRDACGTCDLAGKEGTCSPHVDGAPGTPSCTPFLCDGTTLACPLRCDTNADCVGTAFCDEGRCVDKRKLGQACADNVQCANALCVDKVCCKSACSLACDVCQAVTGDCLPAPARSPGAPSCAPYTCPGDVTACAATCNNSADCAQPDFGCRNNRCVERIHTFKDNFDSNMLPNAKWPTQEITPGMSITATGGELQFGANRPGVLTLTGPLNFDARSSSVRIELKKDPGLSNRSIFRYGLRRANGGQIFFELLGTALNVGGTTDNDTGNTQVFGGVTYNPQAHRWLRIRESNGDTFFEASPDGTNFTPLIPSRNNVMSLDSVGVFFNLTTAVASTLVFDNLNVP
ncbi:MAG: hypothetical protein ACT4TC_24640 [Myxococcaceae bacterium]